MTSKQQEVWALYSSGHTISEIARTLGRSKSTVSTMVKTIKERIENPLTRASRPCEYSSSCFTCPLGDCVLSGSLAVGVNLLPWDMEVHA